MPVSLKSTGGGSVALEAPNTASNRTLTLPDGDGAMPIMKLETAKASTSGTSIDFTGIPSWVKRITVMFDGVSWNATVAPLIQLGDSGGIETTGYATGASSINSSGVAGAGVSTAGFGFQTGWDAGVLFYGSAIFTLLDQSTNTWVGQGCFFGDWTTDYTVFITGRKSLSATLDRVRVTSTGPTTFDAGSINILYEG